MLITTPIFYVNGEPHIGHLYTMIYADIVARWNRIKGRNVIFTTGWYYSFYFMPNRNRDR